MAGPKTCDRCGTVSFSRAHDLTRNGWVVVTYAAPGFTTETIWTCAHCQQKQHERIHDGKMKQAGLL